MYIPKLLVVLITPTSDGPTRRVYPNLSWYHIIYLLRIGYYNMYMFCSSMCGISFIVSLIQSTIVGNNKISAVACFDWIQFYYDLTDSIFSMHSHSCFNTHLQYFHFQIYHIHTTVLLWSHNLLVETIFVASAISQVLMFIRIQFFFL